MTRLVLRRSHTWGTSVAVDLSTAGEDQHQAVCEDRLARLCSVELWASKQSALGDTRAMGASLVPERGAVQLGRLYLGDRYGGSAGRQCAA
jgi:hypothetical protein